MGGKQTGQVDPRSFKAYLSLGEFTNFCQSFGLHGLFHSIRFDCSFLSEVSLSDLFEYSDRIL